MTRLTVAAAGNADDNINLINPRFQAEALRRIRGYDVGVLENSFYDSGNETGLRRLSNLDFMWKLSASNVLDIAVGRGMATAYGFDIQSEQTVHLTASAPSSGTKYLFVYLEWDLSNPVEAIGKIDIFDNGSSSSWTPARQDNLITNPIGVYQMPIYRLSVNTLGEVISYDSWVSLGIKTIGAPLRSNHANHSELADCANYAAGDTSGATLKGHLDGIYARLATLGFRHGGIILSFGDTTINLSNEIQTNGYYPIQRQGNYVIGNIDGYLSDYIYISNGETKSFELGTIPEQFRPIKEEIIGANRITSTATMEDMKLKISPNGKVTFTAYKKYGDEKVSNFRITDIRFGYEAPPISVQSAGGSVVWVGEAGGNNSEYGNEIYYLGNGLYSDDWEGRYSITVENKTTNEMQVITLDANCEGSSQIVFGNHIACWDTYDYNISDGFGEYYICNKGDTNVVVTSIVKLDD